MSIFHNLDQPSAPVKMVTPGDISPDVMGLFQALWKPGWIGFELDEKELTPEIKQEFNELLKLALIRFQLEFDFPPTGELTPELIEMLNAGRCGRIDLRKLSPASFTALPADLPPNPTFEYDDLSSSFSPSYVTNIIARSLNKWGAVLGNVRWFEGPSPIVHVAFKIREHGIPSDPFDGPGGVLAHAWSLRDTQLRGTLHLDGEELWDDKYDLETIILHECGHIYGLEHSFKERSAVMTPYYGGIKHELTQGDVNALRTLYGR